LKLNGSPAKSLKALRNLLQVSVPNHSTENGRKNQFSGNGVLIREASPQELSNWDKLVTRFDNYRVFHKTSWLRSVEAFSGAQRLQLVFEKEGEIVACLPGFLVRKAFLRIFGSPLVGWQTEVMGPVFDRERISAREICATLTPFLISRYGVQHIELVSAHLDRQVMNEFGFQAKLQHTCRVALFPGDQERTMKNIDPKTRSQTRKAIRLGLIAKIETDDCFIDEFYDQLKEVFTRRGNAVPFSLKRARQWFLHMKESGNLLAISICTPEGICIATGLFMVEGRELNLWGWTHRTKYRPYCPTELLMWTALEHGMKAGCETLDMAGGGAAKAKFGARPDETVYRFLWSRYEWLAHLRHSAEKTYRWQQRFRGRLARRRLNGAGLLRQKLSSVAEP